MRAETGKRASVQYALLDSETTREVHVLPVDHDGLPCWPHEPRPDCPCTLWRDDVIPYLYVHDHIQ